MGGIIRKMIWILLIWDLSWLYIWYGEMFWIMVWIFESIIIEYIEILVYKGKLKVIYDFWVDDLKCFIEDDC